MKQYIIDNIKPLLVGFAVAMVYNELLNVISDIIIKIALIHE